MKTIKGILTMALVIMMSVSCNKDQKERRRIDKMLVGVWETQDYVNKNSGISDFQTWTFTKDGVLTVESLVYQTTVNDYHIGRDDDGAPIIVAGSAYMLTLITDSHIFLKVQSKQDYELRKK